MPFFSNKHNIRIFYKEYNAEKEDFIPLIFIHGYGSSLDMFIKQINDLKHQFRIILFDAAGCGKSDVLGDEIQKDLLKRTKEDLVYLMELLGIPDNDKGFGIITHSILGGSIGINLVEEYQEQVKFLILLNPGTLILDSTIKNIYWNLLPQFNRMNFNEMILELDSLESLFQKTIPFIRGALYSNVSQEVSEEEIKEIDQEILNDLNDLIDLSLEPKHISCPTLIIGGELDNYAPYYMAKNIYQHIPNSELFMVSMAGHFGISQRFEEYNSLIKDFLIKNDFLLNENNEEEE